MSDRLAGDRWFRGLWLADRHRNCKRTLGRGGRGRVRARRFRQLVGGLRVRAGEPQRLANALEKKKELSKGLEAEREYADAYIAFVEYVERVYNDAQAK